MASARYSVVTLTSSAIKADALFLQDVMQLQVEDETATTLTLIGGDEIIIILSAAEKFPESRPRRTSSINSSILLTDKKVIHNAVGFARGLDERIFYEEISVGEEIAPLCRLYLPSSTLLILAPMALLESKIGRTLLADRLNSEMCQEKRQGSTMAGNSIGLDNEGIGDLYDLQLEDNDPPDDETIGLFHEHDWKGAIAEDQSFFDDVSADERNTAPSTQNSTIVEIDNVVPAWVDFQDGDHFKRMFLVSDGGCAKLASFQDCQAILLQTQIPTSVNKSLSSRLSNTERLRQRLGWVLSNVDKALVSTFFNVKRRSLRHILSKSTNFKFHILRALHENHWIEEWAEVSTNAIIVRNASKSQVTCKINISQILEVNDVVYRDDTLVMLQIETAGRTLALLFENKDECQNFRDVISKKRMSSSNVPVANLPNGIQSTKWDCDQRMLLNCGKLSISAGTNGQHQDPATMVATCLQLINKIRNDKQNDPFEIHSFLTSIAILKRADILSLTEKPRLAFFLNLYHTMIMHAFLALGYPSTGFKFFSFFNKVSYEVGGDIFSLTELEHCILRAKMTAPSAFLSRFLLPSSTYNMALTKSDFRINFALNCGSLSNPTHTFVYCPEDLDDQLNKATRMFLQKASVSMRGVVELPKICQWFRNDFSSSAAIASNQKLILMLEPYLGQEDIDTLALLRKRSFSFDKIEVKFLQYSYKCASPQLWRAPSEKFTIL